MCSKRSPLIRLVSGFALCGSTFAFAQAQSLQTEESRLQSLADSHQVIQFKNPVPKTTQCAVRIDGQEAKVLPIWPNAAATSTISFKGNWVGCGIGKWSDFDGKRLQGKVAFLDFDCGIRWLRAFELGAKAVIFVATRPINRVEAEQKFLQVPLRAPRFLLASPTTSKLEISKTIEGEGTIEIECRQEWISVQSSITIGTIRGAEPRSQGAYLLLAAGQSRSFVPDITMDSNESVAALVSAIRGIKARRPSFDIMFAIVGGRQNALQGERELVEWLLTTQKSLAGVITFDLTSGSKRVGMFASGGLYGARPESREASRGLAMAMRQYADDVAPTLGLPNGAAALLDGVNESDGKPWKALAGANLALSCEPFSLAGYPSITFATVDDSRLSADVPREFQGSNSDGTKNLERQLGFLVRLLNRAFERAGEDEGPFRKSLSLTPVAPARTSLVGGLSTVSGRAVQFEPEKSFLPDAPVESAWVRIRGRMKSFCGVRGDFVSLSDKNGAYTLHGIAPMTALWYTERVPTVIDAFRSGPDGQIELAATLSSTSGVSFSRTFMLTSATKETPIVMFPSHVRAVFDAIDELTQEPLASVRILDSKTFAEPRDFDVQSPFSIREPSTAILFASGRNDWISLLETDKGRFFGLEHWDNQEVGLSSIDRATDLIRKNSASISELEPFRMVDRSILTLQERSQERLSEATEFAVKENWSSAAKASKESLRLSKRAYEAIGSLAPGSTAGLLMYLALLAPFSLVIERILFSRKRLSERIAVAASLFTIGFIGLRLLHPAFLIIRNPFVVFVGFVLCGLSVLVAIYVAKRFDEGLSEHRDSTAQNKQSPWSIAIDGAVSALRRRPLRTWLTVLVVATASFAGMAFTSLTPTWSISSQPTVFQVQSTIRNVGFAALPQDIEESIGIDMNERVWLFASEDRVGGSITVSSGRGITECRALLGLAGLKPGTATVPKTMLDALKLENGDRINLLGTSFSLLQGNVEPGIAPVDFGATPAQSLDDARGETKPPTRIDPNQVIAINAEDALALGGTVRELQFDSTTVDVNKLIESTDLPVVVVRGDSATRDRFTMLERGAGWKGALAMFLLGGFFVFQSLMASAMERRTEISLLSALGMTPSGIGRMFFAEALVLGLLGSVIGYFLAQGFARIAVSLGFVQHLSFNFGGSSSLIVTIATMASCVAAAAYPAKLARRLASPPISSAISSPDGDEWLIPSPITVATSHVDTMLDRLATWLRDHEGGGHGFVVESVNRTPNSACAVVTLEPYELGVTQRVEFAIRPSELSDISNIDLSCGRLSGDMQSWRRLNVRWIEALRSEMLDWQAAPHPAIDESNEPIAS